MFYNKYRLAARPGPRKDNFYENHCFESPRSLLPVIGDAVYGKTQSRQFFLISFINKELLGYLRFIMSSIDSELKVRADFL